MTSEIYTLYICMFGKATNLALDTILFSTDSKSRSRAAHFTLEN